MLADEDVQRVFVRIRAHPRLDAPAPDGEPRRLRELKVASKYMHNHLTGC